MNEEGFYKTVFRSLVTTIAIAGIGIGSYLAGGKILERELAKYDYASEARGIAEEDCMVSSRRDDGGLTLQNGTLECKKTLGDLVQEKDKKVKEVATAKKILGANCTIRVWKPYFNQTQSSFSCVGFATPRTFLGD